MRYVCVSTSCGGECRMPALAKAAATEIRDAANADRVAKARRPVAVTEVGRYVDRKAPRLARSLARTLKAQGKRVAAKVSAAYAKRVAKADSKTALISAILDAIDTEDVSDALVGDLESAMLAAFKRAARQAVIQVGFDDSPDIVNQLDKAARDYAQDRGGELIKDLAGTTRDDLQALLSRAVTEGMAPADLQTEILDLGAFGAVRAEMIARTELAYAHVQGNVAGWEETGEVSGTRWILGDMHDVPDVCDDCVEVGVTPLGDDYVDGVPYPPAHPNCICDVVPVLKGDSE